MIPRPRHIVVLLSVLCAEPLSAQGSLLERWVADFVTQGWRPQWMNLRVPATLADSQPYRVLVGSRVEFMSLGRAASLGQHYATVRGRQQLGTSRHALHAGITHDGRSVRSEDDPLLQTQASPGADIGLELSWPETIVGDVSLLGVATLDRGPGAGLVLQNRSPYHSIRLSGWHSNARTLLLTVPTDRATDIAGEHVVNGTRAEVSLSIPLGAVQPSVQAAYERSEAMSQAVEGDAFLTISPDGTNEVAHVSLAIALHQRAGLGIRRAWQKTDLGAPLMRTGQKAGELYYGRLDFRQWMGYGWYETASNHWSLYAGWESLESAASVRLETWPHVELWEQLGATAFRYRGSLGGSVLWFRLQRAGTKSSPDGIAWAVNVGRYELDTSRRDWLVTGLGLGRAEDDSSAAAVRPVVLVGGELTKRLPLASGSLHLFLAGDLPVYGKTEHSDQEPAAVNGGGLAGQLRVGVFWAW
jgi:hypothetical protein